MSFYKLFGGLSGADNTSIPTGTSSISGAETIERLCDRVQSASLIEDRRDALTEIKSLSKKYKLEVGTHAMPILVDVLDKFRQDSEITCLALDSLYNIMTFDESDPMEPKDLPPDISTQFTEMLIKTNSNIELVFDLLDEFEFQTRWTTLKLLNALILNQTQAVQDLILEIPRGVSRLMDLLNDSREVIRNDTILLLNNLTKTNTNIQKIIAFESGFDRIMEIIEGEGSVIDGGIIVEDCFNLLLNLLQMNTSNQNFFKEANYIKMLCKYLDLSSAMGTNNKSDQNPLGSGLGNELELDPISTNIWIPQKITNLNLLLRLIRCLVSPKNQHTIVNDCQKAFSHFGLLHRLCALLTLPGVPAELLGEAISTVGEVIRGNESNQTLFNSVQMQTDPPRPILVILLMSMINEKQPFHLRCSILYCFECFLYKNETTKATIINTLLPKEQNNAGNMTNNQSQITIGQILCSGMFSQNEMYSNWFCAVALLHTINDNCQLKEQLLRVQLAANPGVDESAISLMQQCINILIESTSANQNQNIPNRYKFLTTISLLMLLSTWLANCPNAVNYFLSQQKNISYLISQASSTDTEEKSLLIQGLTAFLLGLNILYNTDQVEAYTVEKLRDIIKKRIGIEQMEGKLELISQHELYTKTLKRPTFDFKRNKDASQLLFDYEFTRLFKSNETLIASVLKNNKDNVVGLSNNSRTNSTNPSPMYDQNAIVTQYQEIIRDQDSKIRSQYEENQELSKACVLLQESHKSMTSVLNEKTTVTDFLSSEKLKMQAKIMTLESKLTQMENKCNDQDDDLVRLKRDKGALAEIRDGLDYPRLAEIKNTSNNGFSSQNSVESENIELKLSIKELNQEQDNLLTLLQEMELKMKHYKKILRECGQSRDLSESEDDEDCEEYDEKNNGHKEFDQLESKNSISSSIKLNNNPTFDDDNLNNEDDYNENYQPNYINQIIESNDYSNNNSPINHTNSNSQYHSSSHSDCSNQSDSAHVQPQNLPKNYPPVPGLNINSVQNLEPNQPLFIPNMNQLNIESSFINGNNEGMNNTETKKEAIDQFNIISLKTPTEKNPPINIQSNNLINENTTNEVQESNVNPFFMQHPFFNKKFVKENQSSDNDKNDPSQSPHLQNYFN